MDTNDPTLRFSDRVENYVKYRPGYPAEVLDFIAAECGLQPGSAIADVGAGTGIFTAMLLQRGYKVYAVEPNAAMRQAAVTNFAGNEHFFPVDGTAEATTLTDGCVSLVVCAQAFHWFDQEKAGVEFSRILVPGGYVALIWNNRDAECDEFARAYEALLKHYSTDYNKVNHRNISDINFRSFFRGGVYRLAKFPNEQIFDEAGLMGRAYSSSYVPKEGTPEGGNFRKMLGDIFSRYNVNGHVRFRYNTEVYIGRV
jgi:SAM-dependent methyltransferase